MSRVLFAILIALLSVSALADFDESFVREKVERRAPERRIVATASPLPDATLQPQPAIVGPSFALRI